MKVVRVDVLSRKDEAFRPIGNNENIWAGTVAAYLLDSARQQARALSFYARGYFEELVADARVFIHDPRGYVRELCENQRDLLIIPGLFAAYFACTYWN